VANRTAGNGVLLEPEHRWECPNCTMTAVTRRADVHTEFHRCAGLAGLDAPMVPAGQRCSVVAVERADYVGGELVTTDDNGRPVMAVVTTRDEGQDVAVYAPTAVASTRECA
jgi:hypothetical protein